MRRTTTLVLGLTMLALGLTVSSCGGGGSKNSAATTTEATVPATTEATTEAATTEAATTEAATTEATTTTSALGGLTSSKNCRDLAEVGQKVSAAFSGAPDAQNLKTQARLMKEFADKAPAEIRDDFRVFADYVQKIADAMGNVKPGQTPDAQTLAKLQKLSTEIDQAKLQQASAHITSWVQKHCKR
jgi:20S proteasome alpha/beta subunit